MINEEIKHAIPPTSRAWVKCPHCGARFCLADNRAECRGVYAKCTRGCGKEFQIIIKGGKQVAH